MIEMKNLDVKQYFTVLMAILLLTDLVILLNVPFLRQILGFLCFTIIPGILIIHILKLNKIEFLKKFVLSIGLSVTFLIFAGLLVNSFYPVILKPLSLPPLLISFNVILMILAFIAYKRNKDDFDINDVLNFKLDLKDKLTSPLLFPVLFPFMAVFGTHLMNTQGNNIILLAMLFLIPAYVVAVVYFRDRIPEATYPIAILMIGIALLFMFSLRSNHIIGIDAHTEYYIFQLITSNLHWDISIFRHAYTACLSVTLLSTIYQSLSNMNGEYIYKIVYALIYSITPLGVYVLSKKYVGGLYAFLASIFFISQERFIAVTINLRTDIAIFFFALAMMVFFDDKIDNVNKKLLFMIFIFSVIVSHYSTSYIFFFIMLGVFAGMKLLTKKQSLKKAISLTIVLLFFASIFFWYSQVTEIPFSSGIHFFGKTFENLGNFFIEELRHETAQMVIGRGIPMDVPHIMEFILTYITFIFIAIGVLSVTKKHKGTSLSTKLEIEYLSTMWICGMILVLTIALPFVSTGYGMTRLYSQLLVILALAFVIGGMAISKYSRIPAYIIILIVLIPYSMSVTGVTYQIAGIPNAITLNSDGDSYDSLYVHDQESYAANWLRDNNKQNLNVYTDSRGGGRLKSQGKIQFTDGRFYEKNNTIREGYIYLRYQNVVDGEILKSSWKDVHNLTEYSHLFAGKSKIYGNGGSEVYAGR